MLILTYAFCFVTCRHKRHRGGRGDMLAGGAGVDIGRPRNPMMAMQLTGPG